MAPLAFLFVLFASPVATALPQLVQVNGTSRDLVDAWNDDPSSNLGSVKVRLDLGRSDARPRPKREQFDPLTLLGTEGSARGFVYDLRRVCDFPCDDENEECHYELTAGAAGEARPIGVPVLALVGPHQVTDFRPLSGSPEAVPPSLLDAEFAAAIWPEPEAGSEGTRYRLRPTEGTAGELRIEYRWSTASEPYATDGARCHTQSIAGLTRVACSEFVVLADGSRLMLVSLADYGAPAADPIAELRVDGRRALLVRLGLKAQTVYGLLVETPQGWKALFTARDYALLC